MSESLSKIPDGMRYYFGREARLRRRVEDTAMAVFDGWSYKEIVTPTVDYYALFERGMGRREADGSFRFTDRDGRMLALRPDITSSVARAAVALFATHPRPLRLCYTASVFRQHPPSHAAWRRESAQMGCELIGVGNGAADMEVLTIAVEIIRRLGLEGKYRIALSNAEVFNGVAANLSLNTDARAEMRKLIDLRDSAALERFLAPYASLSERAAFARLIQLSGKSAVLQKARRVITNQRSLAALDSLEGLWRVIESLGLASSFEIDLGDVSGLGYYTGLTFKIYVTGAGSRVGSGGRYDHLTANFGKAEPAVGFVLDLEAVTSLRARSSDARAIAEPDREAVEITGKDQSTLFLEAVEKRSRGERVRLAHSEVNGCQN